jgi:hypothetical protein
MTGNGTFNIGYCIQILLCAVLWAAGGLSDPKSDAENSHLVTATNDIHWVNSNIQCGP